MKSRESEIEMCLGQILKENFENFSKPYYLYLSNRSKAIETHQKLMSKSNKYKKLIMTLESLHGTATEKISISSLLIEPVQRIPRYTLLIDEILKLTAEDHDDREHLYSAKDVANQIASVHEGQEEITARVINNLITSVKNCPPTLLKTNRRLISHIDADEIDILNGKVLRFVTLILFNDILVVVKRVSQSASGHSHRTDFKFKSCVSLTSVDISIPKRSAEDPERLDDIIYIRVSDNAMDDQEYFSSGRLRQYVLGNNSHGGPSFVRLVNEQRASTSVSGEDQSFILKKHVGASDVFFCIRPQQGYNLCTTKNSMALCFESPDDDSSSLVSNPTILGKDGGLLIVQKHDNNVYRSTLCTSLPMSEMNSQKTVATYQLTELLNRSSPQYQRTQFSALMMKQPTNDGRSVDRTIETC
ncbi:hypothetical protein K450DRAFT_222933 [Umbelopsis ramanniana AG]|uniref:DH domain-containing protein n=1 Tax=Umbelopsis ramanniana AG TaxID=1314678 RepID=A0AAD5EH14_UMBRA|nr:uncharacterized protein K450DRAFT_222933 [Umbelopsis ramanniana AG]KAI8583297.1 hypothetical protein K450DRAFT_222933 [Umbelopsis ramanniana AG]